MNMKKWFYIWSVIQLLCISCFDDESNSNIHALNPIVIDNLNPNEYFSLYMGDTLKVEPVIYCEGVPDAKLSFEWKLMGGSIVPKIIDSTMYCCAQILAPPFSGAYELWLTVKDETTGICRIERFSLKVQSPFDEGLVVAYTEDDINSDLSLIQAKEVSGTISDKNNNVKIFEHLWSQNNGEKMPGLVLAGITSSRTSPVLHSMTVVTTEKIFRADYYDYLNIPEQCDEALFQMVPPNIGHGYTSANICIHPTTKHEMLELNGMVSSRDVQRGINYISYPIYPNGVNDYHVSLSYAAASYSALYCYDDLKKRMIFFKFNNGWVAQKQNPASQCDISDLSAYSPFFLGESRDGITLLMKENETGAYKAVTMNVYTSDYKDRYVRNMYDFSAAQDLGQAKYWELNPKERMVYYASDTKLYAASLNPVQSEVAWTAPNDEIITGIKLYNWRGGRMVITNDDGSLKSLDSQFRMMMIFTYNPETNEGRINCVPILTYDSPRGLSQGKKFQKTFGTKGEFGKILKVFKQER